MPTDCMIQTKKLNNHLCPAVLLSTLCFGFFSNHKTRRALSCCTLPEFLTNILANNKIQNNPQYCTNEFTWARVDFDFIYHKGIENQIDEWNENWRWYFLCDIESWRISYNVHKRTQAQEGHRNGNEHAHGIKPGWCWPYPYSHSTIEVTFAKRQRIRSPPGEELSIDRERDVEVWIAGVASDPRHGRSHRIRQCCADSRWQRFESERFREQITSRIPLLWILAFGQGFEFKQWRWQPKPPCEAAILGSKKYMEYIEKSDTNKGKKKQRIANTTR